MDACLDDLDCVGFDLDERDSPPSCWLHLDENNIADSNIRTESGVTLFILIERCQGIVRMRYSKGVVFKGSFQPTQNGFETSTKQFRI